MISDLKPKVRGHAQAATVCPICKSYAFRQTESRLGPVCAQCNSHPHERLMALFLEHFRWCRTGTRVLHLSPSDAVAPLLQAPPLVLYDAIDLRELGDTAAGDPLRDALSNLLSDRYDLIVHNHVLDAHTPDISGCLAALDRSLAPKGHHLFTLPIAAPKTETQDAASGEQSPPSDRTLPPDQVAGLLYNCWGHGPITLDPVRLLRPAALTRAALAAPAWGGVGSAAIFANKKPPVVTRGPDIQVPLRAEAGATLEVFDLPSPFAEVDLAAHRRNLCFWVLNNLLSPLDGARLTRLATEVTGFDAGARKIGYQINKLGTPDDMTGLDQCDVYLGAEAFRHLSSAEHRRFLAALPDDARLVLESRSTNAAGDMPLHDDLLQAFAQSGFRQILAVAPAYETDHSTCRWMVASKSRPLAIRQINAAYDRQLLDIQIPTNPVKRHRRAFGA